MLAAKSQNPMAANPSAQAGRVIVVARHGCGDGLTLAGAIEKAAREGLAILPNRVLDGRILSCDLKIGLDEEFSYPVWSGTLVAYGKPGEKLGKEIVYVDPHTKERYVFPVKREFQGETGLLAVEHGFIDGNPAFGISRDGRDLVFTVSEAAEVKLETAFPEKSGCFLATNSLGIPIGESAEIRDMEGLQNARYLIRTDAYAGLAARGGRGYRERHCIKLNDPPSLRLGMLAIPAEPLAEGIRSDSLLSQPLH